MTDHAEGTFEVTSWNEEPGDGLDEAGKVTRARIGQRFAGGITAETVFDSVMTYRDDGTAEFLGYQKVVGRVAGREGSFVLQSIGTFDGKEARARTSVVEGSGKGELAGLRGTGTSAAPIGPSGTFSLDYDLG